MSGVTVLEEIICRKCSILALIIIGALIIILMMISISELIKEVKKPKKKVQVMGCILNATTIIIGIIGIETLFEEYNDMHTEYVVKVDNSVSANEFLSHYEIISHDGSEYRVKISENKE